MNLLDPDLGYFQFSIPTNFFLGRISIFLEARLDNDGSIGSAIITLRHTLDLEVIAEGVETDEQPAILNSQACDAVPGFLFTGQRRIL